MFLTRRRSLASVQTSATILSNGHRIEHQVAAQAVQLERLVVEHRASRLERQHVLARRLRVHRDEEVDFLLAGDVAAWLARIVYQVGSPAMFDGNMFLPETGTPI